VTRPIFDHLRLDQTRVKQPLNLRNVSDSEHTTQSAKESQHDSSGTSSENNAVWGAALLAVFLMMVGGFSVFGFSNMIVAAEGFFIFGGWFGLRVASSLGEHKSKRMMDFRDGMAIGAGLCGSSSSLFVANNTGRTGYHEMGNEWYNSHNW
jgi:hypothetical protein